MPQRRYYRRACHRIAVVFRGDDGERRLFRHGRGLESDQIVQARGTLVLIGGVGVVLGPVSAALAMQGFGPNGFFWGLAAIHAAIGLFALYRMTQRQALPVAEQGAAYIAQSPRQTAVAAALCAEEARADDAREADLVAGQERTSHARVAGL